jgi:hypothetical protein
MIEVTRPKVNRFKYAAVLLGAMAVAGTPLAYPAIATAEANTWDIESYDNCVADAKLRLPADIADALEACCWASGGYYHDGRCWAPPAEPASGSRQLPGNVHIPSDIATAPTVTKDPPRPIRVPSDIATVSTVSQGNELAS